MGTIPPAHSMDWNCVLDSPFFVSFFLFSLWSVCIYLSVCISLLFFLPWKMHQTGAGLETPQELGWNG